MQAKHKVGEVRLVQMVPSLSMKGRSKWCRFPLHMDVLDMT